MGLLLKILILVSSLLLCSVNVTTAHSTLDNLLRFYFWTVTIFVNIYWFGASLVVQWLRICLSMQGTRVRALVWENPTCRGATKPVRLQLLSLRVWSLCSATGEAATLTARAPR